MTGGLVTKLQLSHISILPMQCGIADCADHLMSAIQIIDFVECSTAIARNMSHLFASSS